MKRTLQLFSIFALLFTGKMEAQTIYAVTCGMEKRFRKDFGNAEEVRWSKLKETQIAHFKIDGKQFLAWYSPSAELIAVGKDIAKTQLPKTVQNVLTQTFSQLPVNEQLEVYYPGEGTYYIIGVENAKRQLYLKINAVGNFQVLKKIKK